jgi:hemoglobin
MKRPNSTLAVVALVFAVLALGGCSGRQVPVAASQMAAARMQASLYDRLGGQPAITAVVDQFVVNVGGDDRINHFFAGVDPVKFKALLVDQICQASGGPCTYTGRDMKTAHAKFRITEADFNALVEDLVAALDQFSVPEAEKNELLGLLGPMKGDIVNA